MATKREIEKAGEGLNTREESGFAIRDISGKYTIDYDRHRMWFRAASKDIVDQDNKAIRPTAWARHMAGFVEYGPFCDSHMYTPVTDRLLGSIVDFEIDGDGLLTQVEFAADPVHPKGQAAWYLYSNNYARAVSISWDEEKYERAKTPDGREYLDVTEARPRELSACIMPADMASLSKQSDPMAMAAVRALSPNPEPSTRFTEIKNVELEVVEDPDRIGEVLNVLGELQARVAELVALQTKRAISTPDGVHNIDSDPENPLARFLEKRAKRSKLTGQEAMDALYEAGRKKGNDNG